MTSIQNFWSLVIAFTSSNADRQGGLVEIKTAVFQDGGHRVQLQSCFLNSEYHPNSDRFCKAILEMSEKAVCLAKMKQFTLVE